MSVQTSCPDPFLNLVTGVYVINLDQRPDRWEKIQRDVSGIIPSDKITRSPAVLGRELPGYGQRPWFHGRLRDKTWAARAGCTLAHRQALELGTSQSTGPIMVLEDDIFFAPESSNVLPKLGVWLRDHSDEWDICYLGYTDPVGPSRQLTELPDTAYMKFLAATAPMLMWSTSACATISYHNCLKRIPSGPGSRATGRSTAGICTPSADNSRSSLYHPVFSSKHPVFLIL